jgi:hypothetical protein
MEYGFIYILINDSMNGIIKIGSTVINAQERAKQISSNTGVPTPFKVAYELYVQDYKVFEKKVHDHLADFRVNPNREFFNYPLYKAIKLIEELNSRIYAANEDKFEAMEILPYLHEKYGEYIVPTISSIRIYQTNERVYLEFTKDEYIADYLKDQYITRRDLGFIIEGIDIDEKTFNCDWPISTNVKKFLEFDDYSMCMCVGEIFTEEGYLKL